MTFDQQPGPGDACHDSSAERARARGEGEGTLAPTGLSGDDLAQLFRAEQGRLCRTVRRRVGDADEAADLVQDAFIRLVQARPAGLLRSPQAYLQRVVSNLLRDRAKRVRTRLRFAETGGVEAPEQAVAPEQEWALEVHDLQARYANALEALSPRTREVFLLHRVDELRYRDIAARLGITVATVEYHMARALVHLDRALIQ